MTRFWLICLGGGVGTGARYLLSAWAARTLGTTFPYGTLMVNVIGSFLAVGIMALAAQTAVVSEDLRLVLTTGVMGGFTTYSAFNYETMHLFSVGSGGLAILNIFATVVSCLIAGGAALLLVRLVH